MRRLIALLILVAVLFAVGGSLLADPIHIGGGPRTTSSPIHIGGGPNVLGD